MTAISVSFRKRRALTWLALTLLLGALFAARANLIGSQSLICARLGLGSNDLGLPIPAGHVAFAVAGLLAGPLVDFIGGRRALRIGIIGAVVCNLLLGLCLWGLVVSPAHTESGAPYAVPVLRLGLTPESLVLVLTALWVGNNAFHAMASLSIPCILANWFRTKERGFFAGLYHTLSPAARNPAMLVGSLFVTVAYETAFILPALLLAVMGLLCWSRIKESPQHAGFDDFDTGDAPWPPCVSAVGFAAPLRLLFSSATPWVVALCVLCIAVVQFSIDAWLPMYLRFAMGMGMVQLKNSEAYQLYSSVHPLAGGVGLLLAGAVSDRLRSTSRIPQLCTLLLGQTLLLIFLWRVLDNPTWVMAAALGVTFLAQTGLMLGVSVLGMDLGRQRAVATVVGLIVFASYAGSTLSGRCLGRLLDYARAAGPAGSEFAVWPLWPLAFAALGLVSSTLLWRHAHIRQ